MTAATDITPATNREDSIRVSARSDVQALARSISRAIEDSGKVSLRAIGAGAVNQMAKGVTIARTHVALRGEDLVLRTGFESTKDISRPGTSGSDELSVMIFHCSVE